MVKYIVLSCLLFNSAYILAQKLDELMLNHFNVPATAQNILTARNPNGESILHIIPSKAACAKDASEVCDYAKALSEIPEDTLQELKLLLEQEGSSIEHHVVKIMQDHPGPKTIDNLATFFAVGRFYKENKQPRKPVEDCAWDKHLIRDGGMFVGGMAITGVLVCISRNL